MKSTGIIAFCGSKGSGKSTSYDLFKQFYNGPIEEVALAGHLKEVCSKVFGLDMKYFIQPELKEVELETFIALKSEHVVEIYKLFNVDDYSMDTHVRPHMGQVFETPRKLLQYIGTEVLHPIDPLVHAKIALTKKDDNKLTVVTDLRFVNEFNFLKETLGDTFTPVYVKRSSAEILAENDSHPSERELTLFKDKCYLVQNETSMLELKERLTGLVAELFKETTNDESNTQSSQKSKENTEQSSNISQNS